MTDFGLSIEVVAGNDLDEDRTVGNVPLGQTVAEAWLSIKLRATDPDNEAVIQKHITTASSDEGVVVDEDADDGTAMLTFFLTAEETLTLDPSIRYVYDIQVFTSADKTYTGEVGVVTVKQKVTTTIAGGAP